MSDMLKIVVAVLIALLLWTIELKLCATGVRIP